MAVACAAVANVGVAYAVAAFSAVGNAAEPLHVEPGSLSAAGNAAAFLAAGSAGPGNVAAFSVADSVEPGNAAVASFADCAEPGNAVAVPFADCAGPDNAVAVLFAGCAEPGNAAAEQPDADQRVGSDVADLNV